jgi:predicted enzyme related to lactoylglutathione lyase
MSELFEQIDCIELYVSNLDDGIKYYCDLLKLRLLWRKDNSAGLGLKNETSEIVLQTERNEMNIDFKVESVEEAVKVINNSGGTIEFGPFDIPIGKCAVVRDKWNNKYVILDMSKGKYITDENKNVIGLENNHGN